MAGGTKAGESVFSVFTTEMLARGGQMEKAAHSLKNLLPILRHPNGASSKAIEPVRSTIAIMITSYTFSLPSDEERLAQALTRDAWVYFSDLISKREVFHIKEIPMMPRRGIFEVTNDAEIIQFYLDHALEYEAEFALLGWEAERYQAAATAFIERMESETGLKRGMGVQHHSRTAG